MIHARAWQGFDGAPSLDVMLLKQQFFTASGISQKHEEGFQYAYRHNHPLLQFLPLKLAAWIAKNFSLELDLPPSTDPCSSEILNRILTRCLISDRRGNNLHTFHCVEFESDLYRGIMRARCYPFNMAQHRFRGKNVKVRSVFIKTFEIQYPKHYLFFELYRVYICNVDNTSAAILQMYFTCAQLKTRSVQRSCGRHSSQPGFLQRI